MVYSKQTSLNAGKTKYLLFHEESARDSIPLRLQTITFNSSEIKRVSSIKFLRVIIVTNMKSLLRIK